MQEQQHNGQCQTYIYDPDEAYSPLARVDHLAGDKRGEKLWFSTDLNGAPLEVTDGYGELRWSGRYRSFGEVIRQTEGFHKIAKQAALTHQPLRYAGQYADSETGLHYNLFRYYDPQTGRFTVQDPIGLAGRLNLYAYAPNPLTWIDPLGLARCEAGVASGKGSNINGKWLKGSHGNAGLFPSSVADKLRGRQFKSFDDFRENFWKEVANDTHLSRQFSPSNISRMKGGKAPIAHTSQWNEKNRSYVLRHRTRSNMVVVFMMLIIY